MIARLALGSLALLPLLALLAAVPAPHADAADEVVVIATVEPPAVRIGEYADLNVTVQGRQSTKRPTIDDDKGLTIQYVGPSSQVSIVNGRMASSVTHRFVVSGSRPGRYDVGPIRVDVDGQMKDGGSVAVEILPASAPPSPNAPAGTDQISFVLTIPRTEIYLHERIPIKLVLRIGDVRVDNLQYPAVQGDGFALEDFEEPTQRRQQTSRGSEHVVEFNAWLKTIRQGPITLGPATMGMSVIVPARGRRGSLLGGVFGNEARPIQVAADAIALNVLPLPEEGRPSGFSGAVGRFTMDVGISPREVNVGDPITVTTRIRGEGALDGIAAPALSGDERIRVYPVQTPRADETGGRSYEQVVLPLAEGPLALAGPTFSYFDPQARAYKTLAEAPVSIAVKASASAKTQPRIIGGTVAREIEAPAALGRDLVFIKDAPGTLAPIGTRRTHRAAFWLVQLVPLLLWAGASAYARRQQRIAGDSRYARFTRAGRAARDEFARAREALGRGELGECHDRAARALRDYLAAKLDLAPGTVEETAPAKLRAAGVESALVDELTGFFTSRTETRFAPSRLVRADLEAMLDKADALLRRLERTRRLRPGAASVAIALLAIGALGAALDATAVDETNPSAMFFSANALYSDERYADAASAYEKILASGLESGAVQYNLGNAYFKAGDVGRAVLSYERARRLIPGDPDLAANLAFAREQAGDVSAASLVARLAFPLAERMSTDSLLALAAVAWWMLLLALTASALAPRAERPARIVAFTGAAILLLSISSAIYRYRTLELPRWAVVTSASESTVRYEPSANGTAFYNVKPGASLRIVGEREGWRQVAGRDGRRGWIEAASVAPL